MSKEDPGQDVSRNLGKLESREDVTDARFGQTSLLPGIRHETMVEARAAESSQPPPANSAQGLMLEMPVPPTMSA